MINRGFDSDWLSKLKYKCDIVSVLSKRLKLEKKGKTFWSCCPFHHEKTPSFAVNENEQFFHCFGCGESGDVITFIQKYDSLDFLEAVTQLADSVGMEIPSFKDNKELFKLNEKRQKEKEILKLTCQHYFENLKKNDRKTVIDYLNKRKISQESIEKFKIGYSRDWHALVDYLKSKNFNSQDLKSAGVVDLKDGNIYDFMGERLVFPIFNTQEECIGFSGRLLEKTDERAKYKNTSQTDIFNKSKAIFAINHIKKLKQQGELKRIILVEGQIDVISMHQNGFYETVACLGTALTKEHARELKRFCDNLILCFDGDDAGIKATLRSLEVLKEFDFNLKIASLPPKTDPDEFLKENGSEKMEELLSGAKSEIDYRLTITSKKFDVTKIDERAKFVKIALEIINQLENYSEKQPYLETIKKLSGIPIDILMRDLSKDDSGGKKTSTSFNRETNETRENASIKATKFILASLLFKKDYAQTEIPLEKLLKNPIHKKLLNYLKEESKKGKIVTISDLYNVFDIDNEPALKEVIYYNFDEIGNNAKQYFNECVWTFCENYLREKQEKLNEEFNNAKTIEERRNIAIKKNRILLLLKNKKPEEVNL